MMAPRPETCRPQLNGSANSSPPVHDGQYKSSAGSLGSRKIPDTSVSKDSSSDGDDKEEDNLAPDGGWGWAVIFGTMIVNVVVIGHAKSFGVYFENLIKEFDSTPSKVAWLQSLNVSMFSFLSPVASVLSQWLGPRKVALFGGMMASCGLVLSAYSPNLKFLYVSFGVIQGIGLTCTFTPGITIIAKYFHKRRGLANGLAFAGNALGGMVIPLVVDVLITTYNLRGCFLIMGGVLLHACVGAMLWQPVEWHQKPKKPKCQKEEPLYPTDCYDPIPARGVIDHYEQIPRVTNSGLLFDENNCPTSLDNLVIQSSKPSTSEPDLSCTLEDYRNNLYFHAANPSFLGVRKLSQTTDSMEKFCKINRNSSSPYLGDYLKSNGRTYGSSNSTESLPILYDAPPTVLRLRHISVTSSFIYLSSYNLGPTAGAILKKEDFTDSQSTLRQIEHHQAPAAINISSVIQPKKSNMWCFPCFKHIKVDKRIFHKSRFYIMTFSLFFHILGYPGTLMFLPYRATNLGLSHAHAASLISVLALTDLTGRICCAWMSDFHLCPRQYWYIGGMLMSGLIGFTLPLFKTYAALLVCTAGFGFCCGAYIGLIVVLFADAYGPEKVALAYSISTVTGGFMALGGPPFMGYVLETTGSYAICQSILAFAQVAGAAIWIVEPWALRYEKKLQDLRDKTAPEEQQLV